MNKDIENLKELNEFLRDCKEDLEKNEDGEYDFYEIINNVFDCYYFTHQRLGIINILQDFLSDEDYKKIDNIVCEVLEKYISEVIL